MGDIYVPQTANGEILGRSELDRIKAGFDKLNTPGWEDYIIANLDFAGGASGPTLKDFKGGIYKWAFPDSAAKSGSGDCHFLHNLSQSHTTVYPHIHWSSNAATPIGNVQWKVDCIYAKGHGQEAFGTVVTDIIPAQACTAQYQHMIAESDGIDIPSLEIDGLILIRIWRDTDAAADTLTGDAYMLRADFHVRVDSRPTTEKVAPFTKVV